MATKKEEKRVKPQPQMLVNEQQETIFNTPMSIAADAYAKSEMEVRNWKDRLKQDKKDLIVLMKEAKLNKMTMGGTKVIKYKYTDAREDIILTDYKPKVPRRKRGF